MTLYHISHSSRQTLILSQQENILLSGFLYVFLVNYRKKYVHDMKAKIYKPSRHTMQVGRAKMRDWILEYEPSGPRSVDPLMSWTTTTQTHTQVSLKFKTKKDAMAYAEMNHIPYTVLPEQPLKQTAKSYASNFAFDRIK